MEARHSRVPWKRDGKIFRKNPMNSKWDSNPTNLFVGKGFDSSDSVCVCNPIALCMDLKNCLGKWECCSMFPV